MHLVFDQLFAKYFYMTMLAENIVTVSERLIHHWMPFLKLIKLYKNTTCQNPSLLDLLAVKYFLNQGVNVWEKMYFHVGICHCTWIGSNLSYYFAA